MPEGKGEYPLTDMEESRSVVQYQFVYATSSTTPLSEYLLLELYAPLWVVNRCPDPLL